MISFAHKLHVILLFRFQCSTMTSIAQEDIISTLQVCTGEETDDYAHLGRREV